MTPRRILTSLVLCLALASVVVQAAGADEAGNPRTLLTTRAPIRAFAQGSSRIAWIGAKWHVDVRGNGRRPKTVRLGTAHPYTGNSGVPLHLAVAGTRVLWTRQGGGNLFETSVCVRKTGSGHAPKIVFLASSVREGGPGSYFGPVVGVGSTLAYSAVDYECVDQNDCSQLAEAPSRVNGVFRVIGTSWSTQLPAVVPAATELAVSGNRLALLPAPEQVAATQLTDPSSPPPAAAGTAVQIRDATTGSLVTQFTPPGTVRALALSGGVAAVVDDLGGGTRAIERYDATTGALLGTTGNIAVGDALSASGHTLVYAVGGGKIEAMDFETGALRVIGVSPTPPIGLSIAGKRVAWAVNVHGHGRVLALTLP
ncbi:MAG TPA: hypothetical protein VE984_03910 [Gaiellaceae bacterium]|nr:hypothetical protein [Gaiellaceae bacterium]